MAQTNPAVWTPDALAPFMQRMVDHLAEFPTSLRAALRKHDSGLIGLQQQLGLLEAGVIGLMGNITCDALGYVDLVTEWRASGLQDPVPLPALLAPFMAVYPRVMEESADAMSDALDSGCSQRMQAHDRLSPHVFLVFWYSMWVRPWSWPYPSEATAVAPQACPEMIRAMLVFIRWAKRAAALTAVQAHQAMAMVSDTFFNCGIDLRSSQLLEMPRTAMRDALLVACRCFPVGARRVPEGLAQSLMQLLVLRESLKENPARRAKLILQDSSTAAHVAMKLACVALGYEDRTTMMPELVQGFLCTFLIMNAHVNARGRPGENIVCPVRDATVIRGIHLCSLRIPTVSATCSTTILALLPLHLDAGAVVTANSCLDDRVATVFCALNHCMQISLRWMKGDREVGMQSIKHVLRKLFCGGMHMSNVVIKVNVQLSRRINALMNGFFMPGVSAALEALMRGDPGDELLMLHTAALYVSACASKQPRYTSHKRLLSLCNTILKMVIRLFVLREGDAAVTAAASPAFPEVFVAVLKEALDCVPLRPADLHGSRLRLVLCLIIRPLVPQLGEAFIAERPALIPGVEEVVAPALEECYAARVLRHCSNVRCTNLEGLSDSALKTKLCQGCRRVRYCGPECQRMDFGRGGHKGVCRAECVGS